MRIVSLSTCDIQGGAARAAYRLHQGLRNAGVDASMIVQKKSSADPSVHQARSLSQRVWHKAEGLALKIRAGEMQSHFTTGIGPVKDMGKHLRRFSPDIIHLHWVAGGMMSIDSIAQLAELRVPIVWTLHDMWALTGGCHYDAECGKYRQQCGDCPQLARRHPADISSKTFARKSKSWKDMSLAIVAPSTWLTDCARQSALMKHQAISTIAYGIDLDLYSPSDSQLARRQFKLPLNRKLILFGAVAATSDPRKGFDLLLSSIRELNRMNTDADLVVFGAQQPSQAPDFGRPVHYLGDIDDEFQLSSLYAAVDVMVAPSRQDNLPNTVVESLACGTPVVAFDIGGMADMIEHQKNGWLATPFDTESLAAGIHWILDDAERHGEMSFSARRTALNMFSMDRCVDQYLKLYEQVLAK